MAAASVALGIAIVPGLPSIPRGDTKIALAIVPSMPSQLVSWNIRSGSSGAVGLHSQPTVGSALTCIQGGTHVVAQVPVTQVAVWWGPATQWWPQPPQFIGSVW